MLEFGQTLAFSIPCPAAGAIDALGKALVTPIVAYIIFFPIILVFGGFGGGQISGLIGTLALYFGSRTKLLVFGIAVLCGAVGGGLIAAANSWGADCGL
jgi:hypothetical protein